MPCFKRLQVPVPITIRPDSPYWAFFPDGEAFAVSLPKNVSTSDVDMWVNVEAVSETVRR